MLYDINLDSWGWNRLPGEGRLTYLKRIISCKHHILTKNAGYVDINPIGMIRFNKIIKNCPDTYYFSFTAGYINERTTR
jgi:hypothetical protein